MLKSQCLNLSITLSLIYKIIIYIRIILHFYTRFFNENKLFFIFEKKHLILRLQYCIIPKSSQFAGVMELADVVDSKSTGGDTVPVRVRPPAPVESLDTQKRVEVFFYFLSIYSLLSIIKKHSKMRKIEYSEEKKRKLKFFKKYMCFFTILC